jgi:GMP synthase (glutamine-hydrolysing)
MTADIPEPQVSVLDAGGQYCHLIARRIRDLGVYAEVLPSDAPASQLSTRKAIVISGGPSSVYEAGSPTVDPQIFSLEAGVLGICYGHQIMARLLDGSVRKGERGEYGHATLEILAESPLLAGLGRSEPVWMSHRDVVASPPPGFTVLARTDTCGVAAMGNDVQKQYGVQFHPEVVHTRRGTRILSNFIFDICGCERDWDPKSQVRQLEERIRQEAGSRSVFFFVSGGVDSSVAYTLCLRALGADRVRGTYVDTGFMRAGETEFVRDTFSAVSPRGFHIEDASAEFFQSVEGVTDPEEKRRRIGERFVCVQERILQSGHFLDGDWILGQGTIYPDTIESGGAAKADVIKTHHNRVSGIQRLIEEKRVIEPLASYYKDEVRRIGAELGLPAELLNRHPFPGPGLAIRILCSGSERRLEPTDRGWIIPVRSVGVQGDARTYRPVLALDEVPGESGNLQYEATTLVNSVPGINRAIALCGSHRPLKSMRVFKADLRKDRVEKLRQADAIVRRLSQRSGFDAKVWQFPVILIPVGVFGRTDSLVLRPVDSVDGMTAQSVPMERSLLERMTRELLQLDGVCAVFYDLTHKPPATIEWE